ncbi:MAG: hypothetical protein A2836_02430 [Candidatus Taylorbacteria bacterium RIFCSPHIGHO2_01_FULL_45_63]|uniref:histidine kinase n=1 Tax=Candidatus Taylorbacteria bacterium RIFCSPHIGHO2_02_FULL_45_35 TaxID=1802311 RepID=A0A1G2MSU4_9BACT|nr:MAG: hypothetical protein A2836_02430 [Candidatus Taylorbacteria bacterium RIFCSPHIGHO2_01_FULL_45_63]OHA26938.1 MAG: hypothetical protein A3D56_00730 [Candidatus Taylorbacteria bacterium RIFCSPHIGHO2_02_FULL_45_35]OHA33670.1 MAG: hypothetical protein A3A22_03670 [Candidatus Taylorbacteria bacterium RIFCSPLOWO2_01_FULL_45_34b]
MPPCHGSCGSILEADALRLEQIIVNLLNNAIKYTGEGGSITISVSRENDKVLVSVQDTGVGISPDILSGIFRHSISKSRARKGRGFGGLGIGLQLVKSLAEAHGGSVSAYSAGLGKGSLFSVSLPLPPAVSFKKKEAPQSEYKNETSSIDFKKHYPLQSKVMIVDDNEDAGWSLSLALQKLGCTTSVSNDGVAALHLFKSFSPDIVLLDIGLPGMDGYEVARQLRKNKTERKVFIVAVSGYGQKEDKEMAKAAGFDQHLLKPVSLKSLGELISSLGQA